MPTRSREARQPVWSHPAILYGALFFLVLLVFYPAVHNEFLDSFGDDPLYVTDNPHVNTGLTLDNIKWAFPSMERSNWHPLTWISHMIDCQLYGLKPWGHHLTSVLLHALNAVLLCALLRIMTASVWRSFAVALLFALHPLRVESVAWIAERKDVLSAMFYLLTLLAYSWYVRTSGEGRGRRVLFYAAALLFFACGLMSKAMVVTLPCVLFILDYWPLQRFNLHERNWKQIGRLFVEKVPFAVLAMVASAITYSTQNKWGFVQSVTKYSTSARVENAVVSYGRYLAKMFWPLNLCSFYQHPGHWPVGLVAASAGALVMISVLGCVTMRRRPFLMIGWLWFLGTLVPVIGLVQLGDQAMADRYTYLPMIGVIVMVVWGLAEVLQTSRFGRPIMIGLLACVTLPCIALTRQQISYFKDSVTLWGHDLAVSEKHGLAQYAYALSLEHQGQPDEAIAQLKDIVAAKPEWADARCNLGNMLCKQGQMEEGITQYREALTVSPKSAETHYYLGLALAKKGILEEAIPHFRTAIQISSSYAQAHDALGTALEAQGHLDEAISELQLALQYRPDDFRACNNLGVAFFKSGRLEEAIAMFEKSLRLKPGFVDAQRNLDAVKAQQGR